MAQLKKLVHRRGQIKGKITRLRTTLQTVEPNELDSLQERYDKLPDVFKDFEAVQEEIASLRIEANGNDLEAKQHEDEQATTEFETDYYKTRADARAKLMVATPVARTNDSGSTTNMSRVKLPEIKLPTFDGNFQKWIEFKDAFVATIHSKTYLSSIEKFQYLRGLLVDEAARVVAALPTTADNYEEAWKLLKTKYDNQRLITNSHLRELMSVADITKASYEALNHMVMKIRTHTQALKVLGAPIDHWDMILIYIVTNKLDFYTRTEWEKVVGAKPDNQTPTLKELLEYLAMRCQTLMIMNKDKPIQENHKTTGNRYEKKVSLATTEEPRCEYCNGNHHTFRCEGFGKLSASAKWNEVRRLRLCGNCLKKGHISKQCQASTCKVCSKPHNTLLHSERQESTPQGGSQIQAKVDSAAARVVAYNTQETDNDEMTEQLENMTVAYCTQKPKSRVVLSTAQVYVLDDEGKAVLCRVLLDPGSQLNLVTRRLAERLKLPFKRTDIPVSGVSQSSVRVQSSITIVLESRTSQFSAKEEYLILPQITERLPQIKLDMSLFKIPDDILLADPDFNVPGDIDMLIGAGLFWKLLCVGQVSQARGQPVLQKTLLGWIVGGEQVLRNRQQTIRGVCNLSVVSNTDVKLEGLWKMEELIKTEQFTPEEKYCEEHYKSTHTRNKLGRFTVRLPQNPDVELGNSEKEATRRFYSLEQRLRNNPKLKQQYTEFLDDYEKAGHMSKIDTHAKKGETYYLPHHPVVKEESETTKVRVVFDASAKTSCKTSLNERLLAGPNLQEEIINIVLRFRMYTFVITADIAQMFRQVDVAEQDRRLQRIIWRRDGEPWLSVYELNTVTYGTTCAPFLAMRCLKQLAIDDGEKYPQAAVALKRDFYMDDVLTGSNSLEETIELQKQLAQLLRCGQFDLRKWRANDKRILEHLAEECKATKLLVLDKQEAVKTLGLLWDSTKDILKFNLKMKDSTKVTKRIILSSIAEIYDPIGLIGPVVMHAKVLLQELWLLKLSWDESVPQSVEADWRSYYGSIEQLNQLKIPRNVNPGNTSSTVSLHGFGDASEKGYGACLYALSYNAQGEANCFLVSSKSRVAPLKKVTLPRLELCAAWLLTRLLELVVKALGEEKISDIVLWSDSTIVLHWLKTPPNQLKTFVANRVAEIQETTKNCEWRHVPTKDNPADILSRGATADQLITNELWWHGPSWLPFKDKWPEKKIEFGKAVPETKATVVLTAAADLKLDVLSKFSSFRKLQRVIAFCFRFTDHARRILTKGPLTVDELKKAQIAILRLVQREEFSEEVQALKEKRHLNPKSKILALKPFLDGDGLIRVGGRLQRAEIAESHKHPIVLPAKHFITTLIMRETHVQLKHCGPEQLLSAVRTRYWPTSGRREARKITRNCIPCFKCRPKTWETLMAELPESRVSGIERPFSTTGVDYAGPLRMRESKRRGNIPIHKIYIAVFTCFKTKAVHLELVTDLTTEAFLAALRRFIARRGICQVMYSDNGTNFVGAARELQEIYDFLNEKQDEIATTLSLQEITWKFIPPRAPHFGGLWEAAVKATKKHLYKVTQGLIYTYEEYYTLIVEIEAVLNSRPLTPLSSDPHDLSPLTPSHFLIGVPPQEPVARYDDKHNYLSRWKHLQKLKQNFWDRWRMEYLHQLQTRTKWITGTENLKVGTLVLLVDDNAPPLQWMLGRVTQVYPGTDGVVRVATVKTATGELKRPVRKLCALPFDN